MVLFQFEQMIGYVWRDKSYLLQAFSHASYLPNRLTDCYQVSHASFFTNRLRDVPDQLCLFYPTDLQSATISGIYILCINRPTDVTKLVMPPYLIVSLTFLPGHVSLRYPSGSHMLPGRSCLHLIHQAQRCFRSVRFPSYPTGSQAILGQSCFLLTNRA
jgi:hypothetical protein